MYPIASIWNTGHSVISGMHTLFIILNNIGSLVYGPHHQSLSVGYINTWTLANSPSHHLLCDTVSYTWHQTLLVFEDLSRMCHCVMDRWFLTFWRHAVSSISRVKWSQKMKALCSFEMSGTTYPVSQCENPEDLNPQVVACLQVQSWSIATLLVPIQWRYMVA